MIAPASGTWNVPEIIAAAQTKAYSPGEADGITSCKAEPKQKPNKAPTFMEGARVPPAPPLPSVNNRN